MLGPLAFILARVDEPLCLPRRPVRLVHSFVPNDPAQQPLLVFGIQDLELFGKAGFAPVHPEQAMGDTVKRSNPQGPRRDLQEVAGAGPHFAGRLVGKRDRQHPKGRDVIDLDQPGQAVDQHTGFAATGAGQNQHMSVFRGYSLPLCLVKFVQ